MRLSILSHQKYIMSFKTYSKIFPVIVNSLRETRSPFNHCLRMKIGKSTTSAQNLCNHIDLKCYSTKLRTENKQIYYGVLTPQIKAVKVIKILLLITYSYLYKKISDFLTIIKHSWYNWSAISV